MAINGGKVLQWTCPPLRLLPTLSLLPSLLHCPSTPQVLASLRTVRSNFTILANVTTPTNKSVSCSRNPLPHTCARHDYLLRLQCARWCLRLLRSHVGTFIPIMINRFMSLRHRWRKISSASSGTFPVSQTEERAHAASCLWCMSLTLCPDDGDGQ